ASHAHSGFAKVPLTLIGTIATVSIFSFFVRGSTLIFTVSLDSLAFPAPTTEIPPVSDAME
ncbi:MAG: hypothetical protein ACKVG9_06180, partial [Rhodospirillales bacterium]